MTTWDFGLWPDCELFRIQAIKAAGLQGHPKASELFEQAFRNGHEGGVEEILNHLCDLAEMELGQ